MRLPDLFRKDARELLVSRAFGLQLVLTGPLVGQAFATAVSAYAEASGTGGAAALAEALHPLDGILVPTLGAYDLTATLVFPFVAVRLVSAEKESGALKLLLQGPAGLPTQLAAKAAALLFVWLLALAPGLLALALWLAYGGHLHAPETACLLLGHLLRAGIGAGVAVAAAAAMDGGSSAAIVTLAFTVGTWALDFVAAGRSGLVRAAADLTPGALLHVFERGELRLSAVLSAIVIATAGFALAGVLLAPVALRLRALRASAVIAAAALLLLASSAVAPSWDLSEDRRSSFPRAEERALAAVRGLSVRIHLAAEDPRLADFERGPLLKLRRAVPSLRVVYAASSRTGLFESDPSYGEIRYELGGKVAVTRSTTEGVTLEEVFRLAGLPRPPAEPSGGAAGHPLAASPRWAAPTFTIAWPLGAAAFWLRSRRPWRPT